MDNEAESTQPNVKTPSITLPKGGGAIRGMGEKFAANPVTGTGSMSAPIATSPGRSGFGPQLSLSYDSGSGNGPFGFGWSLSLPSITRKTDKGLPRYFDTEESDIFILSGAEDLVPVLNEDGSRFEDVTTAPEYKIHRYRPRIEGLFARIERWTRLTDGDIHWRSISKENITTLYGKTIESRIVEPSNITHIFSWLICQSYDDKGNAIVYEYQREDSQRIFEDSQNHAVAMIHEKNRDDAGRSANCYLKRIKYGNRIANRDIKTWQATEPTQLPNATWMFEVVLDYGEGHYSEDSSNADGRIFAQAQINPPTGSYWPVRQDPFSSYRAGFEVRTYRLCRRVLMFHHFPKELGIDDCLVRSTEFKYDESPIASFITGVIQSGFTRQPTGNQPNRYLKKSLPPVEFEYSQVPTPDQLAKLPVRNVDKTSLENLPTGLEGIGYQWMDLDGEGTSGILTEQADGWYYKRNLSANNLVDENGQKHTIADFGSVEVVARKPAGGLNSGAQFLDLAGDGQLDLVRMEGPMRGFYERTEEAAWESFKPFTSWPNLDLHDPNLKFVDLTGDGHADILITENEILTWYPSLEEDGFGSEIRLSLPPDEEKGPRLIFADSTQSVYLADLSGDGLSDLVRIRNGEVCFWPNLGYGHFGAKVTMDHSPWFDAPDQFDQKRIRLADIDGSGTTDILYLRHGGVNIYFNECGNSWSDKVIVPQFPRIDNIASAQVVDLLGNGTACLVWSSPLPGNIGHQMQYIALMEDKPHLLIGMKNNLGAETVVQYAPSTKFYLNDKRDGQPWVTRLPFPVHVVERVETLDKISGNRFVTRYAYHHGYFDGPEREFRGFGMVEQYDTEEIGNTTNTTTSNTNWDNASIIPPAMTRTWFHTGAFVDIERISTHFAHEYYREGDLSDQIAGLSDEQFRNELLDDTVLPNTLRHVDGTRMDYQLRADEMREACRSLKGAILRQEIYALDGADAEDRPYSVSERNYTIELLQPQNGNRHAIFFTHAREQVDFHYERRLVNVNGSQYADPRVSHSMTLEADAFGNVLRAVAIGYPRREVPGVTESEQKETHMTLTVNRVVNVADQIDWHRVGIPVETRTYEIVKPPEPSKDGVLLQLFKFDEMLALANGLFPLGLNEPDADHVWAYEKWDWRTNTANAPAEIHLRLIEHVRTVYRKDDLSDLLPFGQVESQVLPGESYKLAFTPETLMQVYNTRVDDNLLKEGKYVHSEGDANWWIPSGNIFYSPNANDSAAQELAFARVHFFLPHRFRDPFGNETVIAYDSDDNDASRNHNLLLVETMDALGNVMTVRTKDDKGNVDIRIDYRVLQPYWVTDPNGNRSHVIFDALGMVVGTAIMGKPGEGKGDFIDATFEPNPTLAQVQTFIKDPRGTAKDLLTSASTRIIYDLDRYQRCGQPPFAATLAREIHARDAGGDNSPIQIRFGYSDGFGREIQTKVQAEAGLAPQRGADIPLPSDDIQPGELSRDADGKIIQANATERWVGTGRTVYNNKGKPVKKYEPFFSSTHLYEPEADMTDTGVTPVLFYDPVERVIATLHPNHTYEKVVFDPWQQTTWDVNDTVKLDPRTDVDVAGYVSGYFNSQPSDWQTWFAQRQSGAMGTEEQAAANKAAAHANTPTVAYFDSLGRTFLTVANNSKDNTGNDLLFKTRVVMDIENNQREVIDAKERIVMRYDYDMLGTKIHSISMDAGELWMLNNVAGKPMYSWDSRNFRRHITYDKLQRPMQLLVMADKVERLANQTVYGEAQGAALNHRTRAYQVYDGAGIVTSVEYDFKGNLRSSTRQLLQNYKDEVDWNQAPALETETFASSTTFDALNRPITLTTPDNSVIRPAYNEANLLEGVNVNLRGAGTTTPFVTNIDYNAKGQRELIEYGNTTRTAYEYDAETFRLKRLLTIRSNDNSRLQDLNYIYDPVGNITSIRDDAQQTIYFKNQVVTASAEYFYDALYRLLSADGREHIGQNANAQVDHDDSPRMNQPSPTDGQAMRNYREVYEHDEVGNILAMVHQAASGNWTRRYQYAEDSNRLLSTSLPGDPDAGPYSAKYPYDEHGNMKAMSHLTIMEWDFKDQLHVTMHQSVTNSTGERTYYVYDASGQRARKVTERANGTRKVERIYLAGYEIYREYNGATQAIDLERETLHIMDDKQRIALVENRTQGSDPAPQQLIRYQYGNHLGSASLELDDSAAVISYEEYYPYGSTSYQAVQSQTQTPKRYRYTGKERDEESGLYYHGARYYTPWLGKWVSPDPIGLNGGINLFMYGGGSPIVFHDPNGTSKEDTLTHSTIFGASVANIANAVDNGLAPRKFALNIDEIIPVSRGGSWSDPANKQLLDWITNQLTKNAGVASHQIPARPQISLAEEFAKGAAEFRVAASQLMTRRFSEVKELENITKKSFSAMRNYNRTDRELADAINKAIRGRIAREATEDTRWVAKAFREIGLDPKTFTFMKQESSAASLMNEAGEVAEATGTVAKLIAKTAPAMAKAGKVLGAAAEGLGKVATPLAVFAVGYQFGTAKTKLDYADASLSAASTILMEAPNPVAKAAGAGIAAGQLIDSTLHVSDTSSDVGVAVYERLKKAGMNDTASFIIGGAASVAVIPGAIVDNAYDKVAGWFR